MITKSLLRFPAQLVHVLCMPAFFMLFALLYKPQGLEALLHTAEGAYRFNVFSFNLSICIAIITVLLCLTRMIAMYLLRSHMEMSIARYVAWCLAEVVAMAAFVALFLTLMNPGEESYFHFLGDSVQCLLEAMAFPYIILALAYWLHDAKDPDISEDNHRIRFYDSRHLLKFATTADSILYIQASENYIVIHYLENGTARKFELRNSMKNMEQTCENAGFVRAHRSYLVNPRHITVIRKDRGGFYFAELDSGSEREIPVSKKCYEKVAQALQ
ncbi:MAG: LytTR family transcriptional regulator [Bacteroidales bacterium]|nr:LytTR family transcriptional regulator [Bacteroidales bacterium]